MIKLGLSPSVEEYELYHFTDTEAELTKLL